MSDIRIVAGPDVRMGRDAEANMFGDLDEVALPLIRFEKRSRRPMIFGEVSCPRLSGPSTMIVWIMKGTTNAEQEAQAGRDYWQAA